VERLVIIGAAHESHPMSTALRAMQRRVVELGLETGRTADALAIARGIAMTTYRTAREFGERFGADGEGGDAPSGDATAGDCTTPDEAAVDAPFAVERYLVHCGARFAAHFPAERFLALSLSTDLHRVDPAAIRAPLVLVAAEGDTLVPETQLEELAARAGGPARLLHVPTRYGHDAFLTEPTRIARILRAALRLEVSA
jgi:homoserine O-acetyltransferase